MLDPGRDGITYSFGISDYSPWDLEMANRGFKVYQYDGTVPQSPDEHPNIIFTKANISGAELPPPGEKNVAQILREHGHESANTIILQIDIEGGLPPHPRCEALCGAVVPVWTSQRYRRH